MTPAEHDVAVGPYLASLRQASRRHHDADFSLDSLEPGVAFTSAADLFQANSGTGALTLLAHVDPHHVVQSTGRGFGDCWYVTMESHGGGEATPARRGARAPVRGRAAAAVSRRCVHPITLPRLATPATPAARIDGPPSTRK